MKGVEPAYKRHVTDLYGGSQGGYDLQRLFEAGEAVQNLTTQPGWVALMGLLGAERATILNQLEGSKPLTHPETSHLLGQLRGLRAAESAALTLVSTAAEQRAEQERRHEQTAGESAAT